jgi:hypothetical protein
VDVMPTAAAILEPIAPLLAERFIEALVVRLTEVLGVSYAFVAERCRGNPDLARAIAVSHNGGMVSDLVYPLPGSPCGDVLADGECALCCGVRQAYPRDVPLAEMGIEGYAGTLLAGDGGKPLGWLGVMHTGPLPTARAVVTLLRALAPRAALELERLTVERVLLATQRELEERIAERTAELEAAHLALERAEEMLRDAGLNPPPRPVNENAARLAVLTRQLTSGLNTLS